VAAAPPLPAHPQPPLAAAAGPTERPAAGAAEAPPGLRPHRQTRRRGPPRRTCMKSFCFSLILSFHGRSAPSLQEVDIGGEGLLEDGERNGGGWFGTGLRLKHCSLRAVKEICINMEHLAIVMQI
jgi:hypothetical protein